MNKILSYTEMAFEALEKSEQYYNKNEFWLYLFWLKASNGFLNKARELLIGGNNGKAD